MNKMEFEKVLFHVSISIFNKTCSVFTLKLYPTHIFWICLRKNEPFVFLAVHILKDKNANQQLTEQGHILYTHMLT